MKDKVCLGAITGSYGVRGEARVKSFCADPSAIGDYGTLTDDEGRTYTLTVTRPVKGGYAVRLSSVKSKEAADGFFSIDQTIVHINVDNLRTSIYLMSCNV